MSIAETPETLSVIRVVCRVVPGSEITHDLVLQIAERYKLSTYDAMILAAAQVAGCETMLPEDMQHGQVFDGNLKVRNPFC